MKFNKKSVTDINVAYIGGGSRGWAWGLMSDLANQDIMSGNVHLYDINKERSEANEIIGNSYNDLSNCKSKWKYKSFDNLETALKGADFVIISILPGTLDEMYFDVHLPEKYGIYQPVGDSVGPGGIIRSLRTIPMFEKIALAIKNSCPDAWVINYTNPMSVCIKTLYTVFNDIKAFGCCHEVFGTQSLLSKLLNLNYKDINSTRDDINVNVLGINHFTWIDKAMYQNIDLLKMLKKSYNLYIKDNEFSEIFDNNKVKLDLFNKYGLLACAGDRHLVEFVPNWYLDSKETMSAFGFKLTPVSERIEGALKQEEKSKKLLSKDEKVKIKKTGEEGVRQMLALLGKEDIITNVNLPNKGQISSLPIDSVVETNASFRLNEVSPIMSGKLPDRVNNLVIRHVYNQNEIVDAGLKRDLKKAFTVFANDPLVTLPLHKSKELFDEMVNSTREFLSEY